MVQDKETGAWNISGWKPELVAEALIHDASMRGVWSPREKVRGRGAWSGADGELVMHLGDTLMVVPPEKGEAWRQQEPGEVLGRVYPTAPCILRPHPVAQPGGEKGPAGEVLDILKTWSWRRPELDPYLTLGWIASAWLGGAIAWRAIIWLTGGKGTGKSTLQNFIKMLFDEHALLKSADATEPSLRRTLKYDSLPVAIDEAESEEDNRQMHKLVKLARNAATGALSMRAGNDGGAEHFILRSSVQFSSVLIPPLLPQDRSRIAILDLLPLGDRPEPKITERWARDRGSQLLRRLMDGWWRWPETVEAYRAAMRQAGHDARGQDVYGTMLAAADLLFHDLIPEPGALDGWVEMLAKSEMTPDGEASDEASCLTHLLSSTLDSPHDRQRRTIGDWIRIAAGTHPDYQGDERLRLARRLLQEAGLAVHFEPPPTRSAWLRVANQHQGLARIFQGTHWQQRAAADGVWVQSLRRLEGARVPKKTIWIGATCRGSEIPLALCLPEPERARFTPTSAAPSPA
ncbi:DNA primase [Tistrella mobilis KA081020-065]|uniref:DNA primase n=2 Tax=Tistrella mobilis TaxID=171437 RepID=I3TGK8_TISMK|nr:DNA primase [Tistrella mobilis KA081020-065]